MSHGLLVVTYDSGGNPIVQIDSEAGIVTFAIIAEGRGNTLTLPPFTGRARRIFVKVEGETILKDNEFIASDYDSYANGSKTSGAAYTLVDRNYIVIEDVTSLTPNGDYGLQVFDSNEVTIFDSRLITSNTILTVNSVIPANSISGDGGVITTDTNSYINMDWSSWWDVFSYTGAYINSNSVKYIDFDEEELSEEDQQYSQIEPIQFYDNWSPILIASAT